MQENRYNTCDRFLGGLEKDFIITEQIEDSPLTSEPSFLDSFSTTAASSFG